MTNEESRKKFEAWLIREFPICYTPQIIPEFYIVRLATLNDTGWY